MLKFLTHKLRTHSLNEENIPEKVDGHDSGTESDDEVDRPDSNMSTGREGGVSPAGRSATSPSSTSAIAYPYFMMGATDLHYDQHSSEEELEVINSTPKEIFRKYSSGSGSGGASAGCRAGRAASSRGGSRTATRPASAAPPEKRKWSQTQCQSAGLDRLASPSTLTTPTENDENAAYNAANYSATEGVHSSDDEAALRSPDALPAPVRFRTSPPVEALKPRRFEGSRAHRGLPLAALGGGRACSCCVPSSSMTSGVAISPTASSQHAPHNSPRLYHYDVSPRKRSRHSSRRHVQRPCLDFDKMQQLKVRAVTAWRHGGAEHGGELSVFCW